MEARLLEAREVPLGGLRAMQVSRTLPQRALPTVGAWCFLDRFGPERTDMAVLPHPHTGLQTVTWPLQGEIRHRDSLGTDTLVRPRQLNLMTSGPGIAHSEFSLGAAPLIHGLQLWVALPDSGTFIPPDFEQHTELPEFTIGRLRGTVVMGQLNGAASPAKIYSQLVGAQLDLEPRTVATVPLRADFEYALIVLEGSMRVAETALVPGPLLYLGLGREELPLGSKAGAKAFLLGGEPFPEDLVMWWNFIGRSHEDIVLARDAWEHHDVQRFGPVPGHEGERIPAPPMPALHLTPRHRH